MLDLFNKLLKRRKPPPETNSSISRPDIDFYFAALSVCKQYLEKPSESKDVTLPDAEKYYVPKKSRLISPSHSHQNDLSPVEKNLLKLLEDYRMTVTNVSSSNSISLCNSNIVKENLQFSPSIPCSSTPEKNYKTMFKSSPSLEQELADRAAEVWGLAVGFELIEDVGPPIEATIEENDAKKKILLKNEIMENIKKLNLEIKLQRQLAHARKENSQFHQAQMVVPGLWVGSFFVASNRVKLYSLGITHKPRFLNDFHYLVLPCADVPEENIQRFFRKTTNFIKGALHNGGNILVHCGAGVSRAPTVCAAFLISELKVSAELALQLVQAVRPFADPNVGFRRQLEEFEKEVRVELSKNENQVVQEEISSTAQLESRIQTITHEHLRQSE